MCGVVVLLHTGRTEVAAGNNEIGTTVETLDARVDGIVATTTATETADGPGIAGRMAPVDPGSRTRETATAGVAGEMIATTVAGGRRGDAPEADPAHPPQASATGGQGPRRPASTGAGGAIDRRKWMLRTWILRPP